MHFIVLQLKRSACAAATVFVMALMLAGPTQGQILYSNTTDGAIQSTGAFADGTATTMSVGGVGTVVTDRSVVMAFQLPSLGAVSNPLISASFSFNCATVLGAPPIVDLYGLGRRASATLQAADYYGATTTPDATDATLLQNNVLVPTSTLGVNITSVVGSANLMSYLNAQYAGGAGAGQFVFLRFSSESAVAGGNRYAVTSAEGAAGNVAIWPQISYTVNPGPVAPPVVSVIASDNFDSYSGALAGKGASGNGWAGGWVAGAAGTLTATVTASTIFVVPAGGAMIGGVKDVDIAGTGAGVPATRQLTTAQTGTFYMGLLMKVSGNPNTGDTYAVALTNSSSDTTNGINVGLRGQPTGGATYFFIDKGTSVPTAGAGNTELVSATGVVTDTRYLVLKIEKTGAGNYNKVTGWVNPATNAETAFPNGQMQLILDLGISSISSVNLRASGVDADDITTIDSLALTKTFADLMAPVGPGPSSTALVPLIQVETAANGSGNAPVPSQLLASGQSLSLYAISRASDGTFLANVPAAWSLTEMTGGVLSRDLVVAADGKSAVFKGNGSGTARVVATGNATHVSPSGVLSVSPRTSVGSRPFIWSRMSERDGVLAKMRNEGWATAQFAMMEDRADAAVAANRDTYLRAMPLSTTTGVPKFTQTTTSATDTTVVARFNVGVDCAVMYHLTGNVAYAQCAADILHNAIQGLTNVTPKAAGWILSDGLLGEGPALGTQLPVIYDFLYDWLQAGNQVYQLGTTGGSNVAFNFTHAQAVFRKYYQLMRDNSQDGNNWSANMSGCLVHNVLALDSTSERATSLNTYLTTDAPNFSSLQTMAARYVNPGDIWPEPLSYSNDVNKAHSHLMTLLEHYDPALNLYGAYPNLPKSMPRNFQFIFPNSVQVHFGDYHNDDNYEIPYFEYEMVYRRAIERNLPDLKAQYGALINDAVAKFKYKRSDQVPAAMQNAMSLFWFADTVTEAPVALSIPRSDTLAHPGLALQRNFPTNNSAANALMYFVCGGGSYVHQHAHGMNMELYGKGIVLGAEGGKGTYGSATHENYYRVAAAHNTVIVNGATQGDGGWGDLAMNLVQVAAMEPAASQPAVSPDNSFTCTTFADTMGAAAEGTQQRTIAIVRTSQSTGYYVDIYRSKSTVSNQFHDYLYHNLGDTLDLTQADTTALPLTSQASRFQTDIGDVYQQPGWRYFTGTQASASYDQTVRGRFTATINSVATYMDLHMPGATGREYAKANSPAILTGPAPYDTQVAPVLAVRQVGEAWNRPFTVIYEPLQGAATSTVTNVTKLEKAGIVVGLKVESTVSAQNIVQYILSNVAPTDTYADDSLGIAFTGRFAIITDKGNGTGSLYVGDGASLQYQGRKAVSQSGSNTQFNVAFTTNTTPTVTTNAPIELPPAISAIADQTLPLNSATIALPFTIGDLNSTATSLQVSVASSNAQLVPLSSIIIGGSGANRTITVTPAFMQNGATTITLTVSDGTLTSTETFLVTVDELAFGRFAYLFNYDANFEGWTANATATGATVSAGALRTTLSGADPQFSRSTAMNIPGNNVPVVLVRMRSSAGGNAQLYFSNDLTNFSTANSVIFAVPADSVNRWYAVNVAANNNWTGRTIKALRLDPPNSTGTVSIDAIIGSDGDFDNDGISDAWEAIYQLDPTLDSDAQLDSDGDGITNASEYVFGSNPASANLASTPAISTSGTGLTLTFVASQTIGTGYAGLTRYYDVETSADLSIASSWVGVPGYTNIAATGQTITINQPLSAGPRFYRLKVRVIP
jgi:hypothetical protein